MSPSTYEPWPFWTTATNTNVLTATTSSATWTYWTTTTGTATSAATSYQTASSVWTGWNNVTTAAPTTVRVRRVAPQFTEEQLEAQRVANEAAAAASERADRLLQEILDDEQKAEWQRSRRFTVRVGDGKKGFRTFRVSHGKVGNITEVNEHGRPLAKYCVHLYGPEPPEDTLVAQKLLLETDIKEFERLANRSPLSYV
jgi:hypothetical protein